MYIRITILIFFINLIRPHNSIDIVNLIVPSQIDEFSSVRLKCSYSFSSHEERFYSLKWFLGRSEFYRETSTSNGKHIKKEFPLRKKFVVDLLNSGNGSVVIRNITKEASGNYQCEVTSNPNKDTASHSKDMIVLANNNSSIINLNWIWLFISLAFSLRNRILI